MRRADMMAQVRTSSKEWDLIIVGGGATGLGTAVDSSLRGYRTVLFEQGDFARATSSRSTKMAHGGVRYLQQGNIMLVTEALRERAAMIRNAPHLVHRLPFVVPSYRAWETIYYGTGLKLYDFLAGHLSLGASRFLSAERTRKLLPTVETSGLRGGILFYDGQFDDARLAINLAQTAAKHGGVLLNYARVTSLLKTGNKTNGVRVVDGETGEEFEVRGKVVINATGPFTDSIRRLDDPAADTMMRPSQGIHLVLDRGFLPGEAALMVPRTTDRRVLFAVPWHDRIIVGTTDTPIEQASLEPRPLDDEVDFLLSNIARYLSKDPDRKDILSVYAGVRPLVAQRGTNEHTSKVSRKHSITVSTSGLVTITGGKWTTYRNMGEKTVNCAVKVGGLTARPSTSADTRIHGYHENSRKFGDLWYYGSDATKIQELTRATADYAVPIHLDLSVTAAQVVFAVREEMARQVEDFLARRTRLLLLDADRSVEAAPRVAEIMADELGKDRAWRDEQIEKYTALAKRYTVRSRVLSA